MSIEKEIHAVKENTGNPDSQKAFNCIDKERKKAMMKPNFFQEKDP
jgi:hypothetical protein